MVIKQRKYVFSRLDFVEVVICFSVLFVVCLSINGKTWSIITQHPKKERIYKENNERIKLVGPKNDQRFHTDKKDVEGNIGGFVMSDLWLWRDKLGASTPPLVFSRSFYYHTGNEITIPVMLPPIIKKLTCTMYTRKCTHYENWFYLLSCKNFWRLIQ